MSFTFQKLYNRLDKDLDLENEVWIDDDLVIEYTNDAIEKAENLINGVYADYFLDRTNIDVTAGLDVYPFPVNADGKRVRYMSIKDGDTTYKLNKQALDRILDVSTNSPYRYRLYSGVLQQDVEDVSKLVVDHYDSDFTGTYTRVDGLTGCRDYTVGSGAGDFQSGPNNAVYLKDNHDDPSEFVYLMSSDFSPNYWYAFVTDVPHSFWTDGNGVDQSKSAAFLAVVGVGDLSDISKEIDGVSYPDIEASTSEVINATVFEYGTLKEDIPSNGCYLQLYPTPREDTTIDFHYLRKLPRIDVDATEAEQLATVIECPVNAFIISYVKTQILEKDGDAKFKVEAEKLKGFTEDLTRKVSIQSADGEDTELTASRETMAHYVNAHAGGRSGGFYRR